MKDWIDGGDARACFFMEPASVSQILILFMGIWFVLMVRKLPFTSIPPRDVLYLAAQCPVHLMFLVRPAAI